jgi:spore photoproduct lyase
MGIRRTGTGLRGRVSWQGCQPVRRPRASPFVRYFDRTPEGIVCPHFHVLAHANGCPFRCAYCYLQLTFRTYKAPVVFTNMDDLQGQVERFLERDEPSVLNAGELSDALAFDDLTGLTERVVPLFARQKRHKLLLLTKSTQVSRLLRLDHGGQTVVAFSLNGAKVADQFEHGAPPPAARIRAAQDVAAVGYPVRFRVDPMMPTDGWRQDYRVLAEAILERTRPERVTLGTMRYFPSLPHFSSNGRAAYAYATHLEPIDGRLRVPLNVRVSMYRALAAELRGIPVALCKETEEAWSLSGLNHQPCVCNCTL